MPLPEMHGRTHCPGGSDPVPCLASTWIAANGLYDADLVPSLDSSLDGRLWTGVYMDQNPVAAQHFSYSAGGGGYGGENSYQLNILVPGVYTFSLMANTNDLDEGTAYNLKIFLELMAGSGFRLPNAQDLGFGQGSVGWQRYMTPTVSSSGHVIFLNSITTPIIPAVSTQKTGRVQIDYAKTGVGTTWTAKLWIVRHGDVQWNDAGFTTPTAGF